MSAFAVRPRRATTRAPASSYAAGLLAYLVEAGARRAAAAAGAAVEPAPERARVQGRRAEARAGAPRQVVDMLLLRGGGRRPRRGEDAHGGRLVPGGGGVLLLGRRRADVEQGLLLVRHRDLLDRRRPVQLQVTIPHGRSNTRAATILIDRFL